MDPFEFKVEIPAAMAQAAPVLEAIAGGIERVLYEPVGAPARLRVVLDLDDGVPAVTLFLRQRHHGRAIDARVLAQAGAQTPPVVELVVDVDLLRTHLEALRLDTMIRFHAHRELRRQRHVERAAVVLHLVRRGEAGRRVARVQVLRVQRDAALRAVEEVVEPHAEVRAVTARVCTAERRVVVAAETEAAVGQQIAANQMTLNARSLRPIFIS